MQLESFLSGLEAIGVTRESDAIKDGLRVIRLSAEAPSPPFAASTRVWHTIAVREDQNYIDPREAEVALRHLWLASDETVIQ